MEFTPKIGKRFRKRLRAAGRGVGEALADAFQRFFAVGFEQAQCFGDQLVLGMEAAKLELLVDERLKIGRDFDGHRKVSVAHIVTNGQRGVNRTTGVSYRGALFAAATVGCDRLPTPLEKNDQKTVEIGRATVYA